MVEKLRPFINGNYVESKTDKYSDIYDPSTGEVIAQAPICTHEEVEAAVKAAAAAFPAWSQTPARRRADLMFKLRDLIVAHFDELTMMVARENGKAWSEAAGDVQKALEMTEFACGIPTLMMGEGQMNVSNGYDTVRYCEPLGHDPDGLDVPSGHCLRQHLCFEGSDRNADDVPAVCRTL